MIRSREDNTVSVIQRAVRHYRLRVTMGSVKEALKSHPDYPTLKSICDVLTDWNIEHYPLKYQPEELTEITTPYLVHFKHGGGQIAFVSEINNDRITYYESFKQKNIISTTDFIARCSGAIILLNPDHHSGEKDYWGKWQNEILNRSVFLLIAIVLILFVTQALVRFFASGDVLFDNLQGFLLLTKITGLTLSILLVLHEYEIRISLTDKLCHLNKATNCNTVLHDKASKVFGWFGWADIGCIYFMGGLLVLLNNFTVFDKSMLAILSVLSLPYPVYSIYYQAFVLKKWCPFCLGVQLVLIAEFILLLPQLKELTFSQSSFFNFILVFLVTWTIYFLAILLTKEKKSAEVNFYKYLVFKKNPSVLKALFSEKEQINIPLTDTCLILGNRNSKLRITVFLSLHCSHCARAFNKIKEILESGGKAGVVIVLITSDKNIINTLFHLNRLEKDEDILHILDQWYNMDPYSRNIISETLCIPEVDDVSEEVSNENSKLYRACNVVGTPTFFINGYRLPAQYDIDDIKYYSDLLIRKGEPVS
jgi:uncharacterized membrane protein